MSYLLGDMIDNKDKLEYLKNIISSSNHMQNIVNDVLDIAQLSEQELRLSYQPFNLRKLLEEESNMTETLVIGKTNGTNTVPS
jgi:signal transduction histidine kinase